MRFCRRCRKFNKMKRSYAMIHIIRHGKIESITMRCSCADCARLAGE